MKALKPTRDQKTAALIPLYNIAVVGYRTFYNAWLLTKLNRHIFTTFLTLLILAAAWIPLLTLTASHPLRWLWFAPLLVVSVYALPVVWLTAQRRYLIAAVNARQIFTDENRIQYVYDYTQG